MLASDPVDTARRVATPEGCDIALRLAGPVTRARAWFFDALIRVLLWWVIGMLTVFAGRFGGGFFMLTVFLLEWFYPVLFEVFMQGQTPGKRACGLAVLHDDGRPVGWGASFIRNTIRFVDFLPFLYATGFVCALLDRDGRRLGDMAAGTVVVYVDHAVAAPAPMADAGSEAPPLQLSVAEQRALIEFSQRLGQLTPERAEELAAVAAPLTGAMPPGEARQSLVRMANFLLGKH